MPRAVVVVLPPRETYEAKRQRLKRVKSVSAQLQEMIAD
jgi:hypothetical protein